MRGGGNFEVFEELFADDFLDHTPQPGRIIPPALNKFQCAMLLEDHGGGFSMLLVDFTIGSGNSGNKSIDIGPLLNEREG